MTGRYSKRKKKNDRDVISYEDMPLDDYEQEKTEMSPDSVKKIIICVVIALVAGLLVFAFANRDKLTVDNISSWWTYDVMGNAGNGYPTNIVGSEVSQGNFVVSEGHVIYDSDTSFVTLSSSANEIFNNQLKYSKPILKYDMNKFLTYGIGTSGYQIDSLDKEIYSGEADDNIFCGDIASNGIYCLVTEGNGYFSTLSVYDSENNRKYKYSFSEYYITSVSLNKDGSGCIASGITSDMGAMSSGIYFLDFTKEKPVNQYKVNDDAIVDCEYITSDTVALVGETSSYLATKGNKDIQKISYDDKTLANYCFNPDTSSFALALSRSGDGRSCTILSYDNNAKKKYSKNTDHSADSLSVYKNVICALDANVAYLYNTDGKETKSLDAGTGAKKVFLSSESQAYVLSVNQIRFIDFNNPSNSATSDSINQDAT